MKLLLDEMFPPESARLLRDDDLVLVWVLKGNLPAGGTQAHALATLIDRWATANPHPYLGQHWPT